jgi:hypothetical protein
VTRVVEHLPSKCEVMSSNPSTTTNKIVLSWGLPCRRPPTLLSLGYMLTPLGVAAPILIIWTHLSRRVWWPQTLLLPFRVKVFSKVTGTLWLPFWGCPQQSSLPTPSEHLYWFLPNGAISEARCLPNPCCLSKVKVLKSWLSVNIPAIVYDCAPECLHNRT